MQSIKIDAPRSQDIIGPDRALTVPYAGDFTAKWIGGNPDFAGASIAAFVAVLSRWGYHFVGCEGLGFNGFFIRADVITEAGGPCVRWFPFAPRLSYVVV